MVKYPLGGKSNFGFDLIMMALREPKARTIGVYGPSGAVTTIRVYGPFKEEAADEG